MFYERSICSYITHSTRALCCLPKLVYLLSLDDGSFHVFVYHVNIYSWSKKSHLSMMAARNPERPRSTRRVTFVCRTLITNRKYIHIKQSDTHGKIRGIKHACTVTQHAICLICACALTSNSLRSHLSKMNPKHETLEMVAVERSMQQSIYISEVAVKCWLAAHNPG